MPHHSLQPTLIILGGFAGVGKSTIARKLSAELQLPWFSIDLLAKSLQASLKQSFHQVSPTAYDVAFDLMRTQLSNGVSVILDANMCHARSWHSADELLKTLPGATMLPIILDAPLEILQTRIAQRGINEPDHLNLGGDPFEAIVHKHTFIQELDRSDLHRINANRPLEDVYQDVVTHVSTILPMSHLC